MAGFTKSIQEIHLDRNIRLLDSPGIVFDDSESDENHVLLKNCVNIDTLEDPAPAVAAILRRYDQGERHILQFGWFVVRCLVTTVAPVFLFLRYNDVCFFITTELLMQRYQISCFDPNDEEEFLSLVARRTGKLLKGGIPDRVAAGRTVLRDWNAGRIPFFTMPLETAKPEKDENVSQENDRRLLFHFDVLLLLGSDFANPPAIFHYSGCGPLQLLQGVQYG